LDPTPETKDGEKNEKDRKVQEEGMNAKAPSAVIRRLVTGFFCI
jgi:hypothetical protein